MYFVAAEYIKIAGRPLVRERFEAWEYGPVLLSLQYQFEVYGTDPIRSYAKNSRGENLTVKEQDPVLKDCLDRVWRSVEGMSPSELSCASRQQPSAWAKAFYGGLRHMQDDDIKADDSYRAAVGLRPSKIANARA